MKSWEEQEEDDRRDRRTRKKQRITSAFIGVVMVGITSPAPHLWRTDLWNLIRAIFWCPGLVVAVFPPAQFIFRLLFWPLRKHDVFLFEMLVGLANFTFYAGVSYFLTRLWSTRHDD